MLKTRSGRVSKKPAVYTPVETCEDDFSKEEYEEFDEMSDVSSTCSDSDKDEGYDSDDSFIDDERRSEKMRFGR